MPEPGTRDFVPRVRQMLGTIDYYLHDLNRGIARIQNGQVPDGSGDPLPGSITVPNDVGAVLFVGPGPVLDTDGSGFFYDDTNNRVGIGEGSPDSKLHITLASGDVLLATGDEAGEWNLQSGGGVGGKWFIADSTGSGFTTAWQELAVNDAPADTNFIYINNLGVINFPVASRVALPTLSPSNTLWTIRVIYKLTSASTSDVIFSMRLTLSDGNAYQSATLAISGITPGSYITQDFTIDTTSGPVTSGNTPNRLQFRASSAATGLLEGFYITYAAVTSGTFSANDTLQKWEYPSGSNLLQYASDSLGTTTLQVSGTPPFRIATSALEFDIGTPAANKFWVATDTEGTGAWTALSSITPAEFVDSAFRIIGSATSTKKLAFEVDGFTAATTRTLTPQDSSYIIAGTNIANTFTTGQTVQPATNVQGFTVAGTNISSAAILNVSDQSSADVFQIAADASTNMVFFKLHSGTIGSGSDVTIDPGNLSTSRTFSIPDATGTIVTRTAGTTIGTNRIPFWNGANATGQLSTSSTFTYTTGTSTLSVTNVAVVTSVTSYKGVSTVRAGVPSLVATSTLTAQSAAIGATTIYAVPAAGAGMYRISWVASITTAATTSCILGGANSFQVTYTDPTDSVVKTSNPTTTTAHTSAVNATATTVSGVVLAKCKLSTNLQYAFDYTSVGVTAMVYDLDIAVEFLG